jgi:hypothetical protein
MHINKNKLKKYMQYKKYTGIHCYYHECQCFINNLFMGEDLIYDEEIHGKNKYFGGCFIKKDMSYCFAHKGNYNDIECLKDIIDKLNMEN